MSRVSDVLTCQLRYGEVCPSSQQMADVVSQHEDETLQTRIESAKPINVSHDFRRSLSSPFYHLIEIGSGRIHKFGQRALCPLLRID